MERATKRDLHLLRSHEASGAGDTLEPAAVPHLAHVVLGFVGSQERVAVHERQAARLPVRRGEGPGERVCGQRVSTTARAVDWLRTEELHRAGRQIHDDVIKPRRRCNHRLPAGIGARNAAARQRSQKRTCILQVASASVSDNRTGSGVQREALVTCRIIHVHPVLDLQCTGASEAPGESRRHHTPCWHGR